MFCLLFTLLPLISALPQQQEVRTIPSFSVEIGDKVGAGEYAPDINAKLDVSQENGRFAVDTEFEYTDLTGYFFNAMILVSVLLLVSNLLNIQLFPNVSQVLENTGALIRDQIKVITGKEGRSLDAATLNQMASIVDQAIQAYEKFN
ncbi:uncharacterized protein LOC111707130 [Eurytemora carolleeae]|uniref:uncharacterized protein LOC111707130 n=1 Tax=Eurytemora carolleeae TaxID=1294199 RepID=UPI000C757505|nr:uncharacterized protein LOC111707130 [Eurytemora carolleeae]|eukprot:XP_023335907.1 uncharacterized protein LOC111707130 [Eurytemora affinis]